MMYEQHQDDIFSLSVGSFCLSVYNLKLDLEEESVVKQTVGKPGQV